MPGLEPATLFQPDPSSPSPLYVQLANTLAAHIDTDRILSGARLPPQRLLATALGVSRNTVVRAYKELEHRGWTRSRVGRGTFATRPTAVRGEAGSWQPRFSTAVSRLTVPFMGETQAPSRVPLSLAHGKVPADPSIVDGFRQMLDLVLEREGARAFDPGPPEGLPSLRAAIAAYLGGQRVPVRAQDILITAGARQALHIIASVLVDPGDVVIIEGPTYRGAIQTFQGLGARLLCVPVDHDGMDVEVLEGMLAHVRPALIYTVPTFQNPTGWSLSLGRRQCLLEAAARSQVPIVEDDPYWELRYDGRPVPRLKALDDWGGVIHLGTFSKLIFPGVRVGWVAAPAKVVEQATVAKTGLGLHVSSLSQWAMARLLEEGMLEPHIRRACLRLRSKRELFLNALARTTRGRLTTRRPEGGFFIWARLNAPFQAVDLLKEAVARGVDFVAGPSFWPNGGDPNALRLCFAGLDDRGLVLAAKHLGDSVTAVASAMDAGSVESDECLSAGRLWPGIRSAPRP